MLCTGLSLTQARPLPRAWGEPHPRTDSEHICVHVWSVCLSVCCFSFVFGQGGNQLVGLEEEEVDFREVLDISG